MSTMVKELYNALIEAGASNEKAEAAAEAMASFVRRDDTNFATKGDIHHVREDLRVLEAKLETKLRMIQWIVSGIGFGILILIIERWATSLVLSRLLHSFGMLLPIPQKRIRSVL
jgi:hypothetical protein